MVVLALAWGLAATLVAEGPASVRFFVWTPAQGLSAAEAAWAQSLGQPLMIKVASVDIGGPGLVLRDEAGATLLEPLKQIPYYAAIRFEKDALTRVLALPEGGLAELLRPWLSPGPVGGGGPRGLYLDLDCPAARLPAYAYQLKALRQALPPGWRLVVTGLPNWLKHPIKLRKVGRQVDEMHFLVFGSTVPASKEQLPPLVKPSTLRWTAYLARWCGTQAWVGLPIYNLAGVYGHDQSLVSLESDLDLQALLVAPALELRQVGAASPEGGSRYEFSVLRACQVDGRSLQKGQSIVVLEPDAQALRAWAMSVSAWGGASLGGVSLYHFQKRAKTRGLTPEAAWQALGDAEMTQPLLPELECRVRGKKVEATVYVRNPSVHATRAWPTAGEVQVRFEGARLNDLRTEPGIQATVARGFEDQRESAGFERANQAIFRFQRLPAWSRTKLGSLSFDRTAQAKLFLFARGSASVASAETRMEDRQVWPEEAPLELGWRPLTITVK